MNSTNNNGTLELDRAKSLDDIERIKKSKTQELYEIQDDLDRIQKEVHRMEIERLNRQWDKNVQEIADTVIDWIENHYLTTDEEVEQVRTMITGK